MRAYWVFPSATCGCSFSPRSSSRLRTGRHLRLPPAGPRFSLRILRSRLPSLSLSRKSCNSRRTSSLLNISFSLFLHSQWRRLCDHSLLLEPPVKLPRRGQERGDSPRLPWVSLPRRLLRRLLSSAAESGEKSLLNAVRDPFLFRLSTPSSQISQRMLRWEIWHWHSLFVMIMRAVYRLIFLLLPLHFIPERFKLKFFSENYLLFCLHNYARVSVYFLFYLVLESTRIDFFKSFYSCDCSFCSVAFCCFPVFRCTSIPKNILLLFSSPISHLRIYSNRLNWVI